VGDATVRRPWADDLRVREDGDLLFLHAKDLSVLPLPKAAAAGQAEALYALPFLKMPPPPPPAPLRSSGGLSLGRTRPIFYLLFLATLGGFLIASRAWMNPVRTRISEPEFLELKSRGIICEVLILRDDLSIRLSGDFRKDGRTFRQVWLPLPPDEGALDRLLDDLPDRAIIDKR
jgi:hypothetical protein